MKNHNSILNIGLVVVLVAWLAFTVGVEVGKFWKARDKQAHALPKK